MTTFLSVSNHTSPDVTIFFIDKPASTVSQGRTTFVSDCFLSISQQAVCFPGQDDLISLCALSRAHSTLQGCHLLSHHTKRWGCAGGGLMASADVKQHERSSGGGCRAGLALLLACKRQRCPRGRPLKREMGAPFFSSQHRR